MKIPTEKRYEEYIEKYLTSLMDDGLQFKSKIHKSTDAWYDRKKCLIGEEYIQFLKETQPKTYDRLYKRYKENTDSKILNRLSSEIENRGLINVLRKGFNEVYGENIETVYFQLASTLNENYIKNKYSKNRFLFVRQLYYSPHSHKSIDIVIFLNGIPILTIELKNQLTGQTTLDSDRQYRFDRDPKGEPLLQFQRCICHFSVDNDRINMTTKLDGKDTSFLPFNKGLENPINNDGYKVSYLWEEILTPNSLLDILENFVLLSEKSEFTWNDKEKKAVERKSPILLFPRYHQLEVIRKLQKQVIKDGVGTNYLIQHTTGSGKSFSIGWLSFMLTNLFIGDNEGQKGRLFDSVVLITDRKVLDKQLQNTVKSLEKVHGMVEEIDKDSEQLRKALSTGKNIIITTIQKFSVVVNRIKELKGRKFAVIVDEVHSSQGGEGTKNIHKTLSLNIEDEVDLDDNTVNEEISKIRREMKARQKQNHISFFGFTGTPRVETIEVFGTPQADGTKKPFHTYTMRQSIGEGFTLDVLKSYTTIKRFFKLKQKAEDTPIPEKKGKKELIKWVDSNPETISKKVKVIIEYLGNTTIKSIGGKGKAMLIVRSIKDTINYFMEMNKQLREKGVHNKIKCVVGFSGDIEYNGTKVNENKLNKENGFDSKDIARGFKNPLYKVLIACNKFQTGFDEPLLHSMFIDKPLSGVQCVQTLSRLNRKTKGKQNTFVLDFVNDVETIQKSFQNFYQTTILSQETDPNIIYDLLSEIGNYGLFTPEEVDFWNKIFFSDKRDDGDLQPILNTIIERWEKLPEEKDKDEFRSQISKYCKFYGYISMIHQFDNTGLEKHYVLFEYLRKKFPVDRDGNLDVSDLVDLEFLILGRKEKHDTSLEGEDTMLEPTKHYGEGSKREEKLDLLSEIIAEMNEFYGQVSKEYKDKTKKFLEDIVLDEECQKVIQSNNTVANKRDKLIDIYSSKSIGTIENIELYKFFEKQEIKEKIIQLLIFNRPNSL